MAIILILIGFSAAIAQILLLRELVSVLNGNELIYGISLMIWLITGGFGSYLMGKTLPLMRNTQKILVYTSLVLSLIIPAELLFARLSKIILNIPSGTLPHLSQVFLISFITIAPVSLLFGSMFITGSRILSNIGNMYFIESMGAVFGGLFFSFLLIHFFNHFQIAGVAGVMLTLLALHSYKYHLRNEIKTNVRHFILISLVLAIDLILIYPSGNKIDFYSSRIQFKNLDLIRCADSPYGRVSVIENNGELSYFENGSLMFSTASRAENEEVAHLPFLQTTSPKNILLLGGGLGGVIQEILKHEIDKLDYIEFDPKLYELSLYKYPSIITDGRHYLKNLKTDYDIIMVNLGDPNTAALNRFYTLEFFTLCKKRLSKNGVLAIRLSASSAFMGNELKQLNSSVYKTLNLVFPEVIFIPGNNNHFFASKGGGSLSNNAITLIWRWNKLNLRTKYFNQNSIPYLADQEKIKYMSNAIKYDAQTKINTDLTPISYLYSISIWLSYFPGILNIPFIKLLNIKLYHLIPCIFIAAFLLKFAAGKFHPLNNFFLPLALSIIGFSAMSFQLIMLYAFQALYGNIYSNIGVLMALFMAGLAGGSYFANAKLIDINIHELLMAVLVLIIAFMAYIVSTPNLAFNLSLIVIPLFALFFAAVIGAIFPIAVSMYKTDTLENKAGVLYGADLLGGAISALLTSLLFLPSYGMIGTCAIIFSLSFASLILTFYSS